MCVSVIGGIGSYAIALQKVNSFDICNNCIIYSDKLQENRFEKCKPQHHNIYNLQMRLNTISLHFFALPLILATTTEALTTNDVSSYFY
jgi:hypothetical protein